MNNQILFDLVCIALILFFVLELLLRFVVYKRTKKWKVLATKRHLEKKYTAYKSHSYIGYVKSCNITNPRFPSNSDGFAGFRDIPILCKNVKNTIRIVVCGGSTVEQNDLDMQSEFDPELTWPRVMEDKLNKSEQEKHYEVINAGCAGYTIVESTIHFLTKCITYKPQYVILYTGINDAWTIQAIEGFKSDYTHARRPPIFPSGRGMLRFFPNLRLSFTYQYTLIYLSKFLEKPETLLTYISCNPSIKMTFDNVFRAVGIYKNYLRSFCGIALANGVIPILIPWIYHKDLASLPPNIISGDKEKFLELIEMNNDSTRSVAKEIDEALLMELPDMTKDCFRGQDWIHFSKIGLNEMGSRVAREFLLNQK